MHNYIDSTVNRNFRPQWDFGVSKKTPKSQVSFCAKKVPQSVAMGIKSKILIANSIDIFPGDDALNCAKVMYRWLKKMGKDVSICAEKDNKSGMKFDTEKYRLKTDSDPSDLAIVLDFSTPEKASKQFKSFLDTYTPSQTVIIDHHLSQTPLLKGYSYIDETARSSCAIIYRVFESLNEFITHNDAKNLTAGILSEGIKAKALRVTNSSDGPQLVKLRAWDNNSNQVLNSVQKGLKKEDKNKIYSDMLELSDSVFASQKTNEFSLGEAVKSIENKFLPAVRKIFGPDSSKG